MPPRSSRQKLPIYAAFPFAGLLIFAILNYNLTPAGEDVTYQNSNILISMIRAMLYVAAGLFLVSNLKRNASWLVRRFELMAAVLFVLASAAWSDHIDRMLIGSLHLIGGIIAAYVAALYFSQQSDKHQSFHFLALVFGVFAIASLISSVALPTFGTQYFEWEEITRWRGLTTNANTLGMACLFAIWSSVAAFLTTEEKRWRIIYGFFFITACINLWGSDSKTSLIVSFIAVVVTILINVVASGSNAAKKKKILLSTYALVVVGIIVSLLFADKFVATEMIESMGRGSDLSGRDSIWADAIQTWKASPIIGWSFDARATAYDYIMQQIVHYHNGYLDLMVRGGIVGLFLFMLFIFKHLRIVTKMVEIDPRFFGPILAISLGFLVHNITEVSLASFDNIFWILILFTYFITERELRKLRMKHRRRRKKFVKAPKIHKKKIILDDL